MDIIVKLPVLLLFGFVIVSLIEGMYFLTKDDGAIERTRVVKALTIRITLSLLLFVLLIVGYFTGFIQPHALG